MVKHYLSERAISKVIKQGRARARSGRRSCRRLYRVARPSICGGYCALHPSAQWYWGVEGEALWTDLRLAQIAAAEPDAVVQDVTREYTGSVFDSEGE